LQCGTDSVLLIGGERSIAKLEQADFETAAAGCSRQPAL
jgi:hypothetical protein